MQYSSVSDELLVKSTGTIQCARVVATGTKLLLRFVEVFYSIGSFPVSSSGWPMGMGLARTFSAFNVVLSSKYHSIRTRDAYV